MIPSGLFPFVPVYAESFRAQAPAGLCPGIPVAAPSFARETVGGREALGATQYFFVHSDFCFIGVPRPDRAPRSRSGGRQSRTLCPHSVPCSGSDCPFIRRGAWEPRKSPEAPRKHSYRAGSVDLSPA